MKSLKKTNSKSVREKIASTVAYFEKVFPDKSLRVLDVGTRIGYAVELLERAGYSASGTDIEPEYVAYATSCGRDVIVDDIMNSAFPQNCCDVIFSRHAIEHCNDTVAFFNACDRLLVCGGRLFITFPLESSQRFNKKWLGDGADIHKVHYETIEDFRAVLDKTTFEAELLCYSEDVGIEPMKKEVLLIAKRREA